MRVKRDKGGSEGGFLAHSEGYAGARKKFVKEGTDYAVGGCVRVSSF